MKFPDLKLIFILAVLILIFLSILWGEETQGDLPSLIPREVLFGNPVKLSPKISPNGAQLAYLAPSVTGVMNVWVRSLSDNKDVMVSKESHRGIRFYSWSKNGTSILYLQDIDGDENFHVFQVDLNSNNIRDLTPFQGVKAINLIHGQDEILVGLNLRNRQIFDMYRINLESGAIDLDTENPGNVVYMIGNEWIADSDNIIRAAIAMDFKTGGKNLMVREAQEKPWRNLMSWTFDSGLFDGQVVGFTNSGNSLYVLSSAGFDTSRILKVDIKTGSVLEETAADERCTPWIEEILTDPKTGSIQAVVFEYLIPKWKIYDQKISYDFALLQNLFKGHLNIESRNADDTKWVVSFRQDDGPVSYYIYDRASGKTQYLFDDRPELKKYILSKMKPVIIRARDGLKLPSYLTLPRGLKPENLPLVLYVHGGPTARDSWGYEPFVQLLANRGCAVLQVNYRGSVGFGKFFQKAGNRQIGVGDMQHDLTDAVNWAVQQGIADPKRVAIFGGSYGGYATLAGLTFTPELYTCGAEACGPSNLKTMIASIPPYWGPLKQTFVEIFGDAENDEEYNQKVSPLFHVQNIRAPLLIGQGKNDPRCNIQESDQIVEAMRKRNLLVTYVVYSDEGHGFRRPENNIDFYSRVEKFFGEHLNIRTEPFIKITGSTAELK